MAEDHGILKRWSRRKQEARAAAAEADAAPATGQGAATPAAGGAGPEAIAGSPPAMDGAEAAPDSVDPATLPPVESLGPGSDFTAFLRAGVPEALRNAALRRLYMTDPFISTFKEVADYDWDFNAPGAGALWPADEVAALARNLPGHGADGAAPGQALAEPVADGPPPGELTQEPPDPPSAALEAAAGEAAPGVPMLPGATGRLDEKDMPSGGTAAPMRRRHGGALPG